MSGRSGRHRIALTMGDPNGIGPEVVLRFLASRPSEDERTFLLVGGESVFEQHGAAAGLELAHILGDPRVVTRFAPSLDHAVRFGTIDAGAGRAAMHAVESAVDLCLSGDAGAMVTAPISKEAVNLGGFAVPGHTEFIAERVGSSPLMIMVAGPLRVALVTGHIPLSRVASNFDRETVAARIAAFDASLRRDFGLPRPRVAVLALNPHAGDGGVLGTEEHDHLLPAIADARQSGVEADGPFAADGFFGRRLHEQYDGVLAAYHDQGLVPFKALSFGRGVNFTAGLPVVRTSPDHGTAFDIAGTGKASASSFEAAVELAGDVIGKRMR